MRSKRAISASTTVWTRIAALRISTLDVLAPKVLTAVDAAHTECAASSIDVSGRPLSLTFRVFETLRTDELQAIYFEQGTTKARTALKSWHAYGLAVDVIHPTFDWFNNAQALMAWPIAANRSKAARLWFTAVAEVMGRHGMAWGGRWRRPDMPHHQWARCTVTPRKAPAIYTAAGGGLAGREAVWGRVGATD